MINSNIVLGNGKKWKIGQITIPYQRLNKFWLLSSELNSRKHYVMANIYCQIAGYPLNCAKQIHTFYNSKHKSGQIFDNLYTNEAIAYNTRSYH